MAGVEHENQDSGISRTLPLLLRPGDGGGKARDGRGGKSEEVEHAGSGAPIMR